jgi:hypothetical protein
MTLHLAWSKLSFKGNAIDPSIAPMISEDDERALPMKMLGFSMIVQACIRAARMQVIAGRVVRFRERRIGCHL